MKDLTDSQKEQLSKVWLEKTQSNPQTNQWVKGSPNSNGKPKRQIPLCKRSEKRNTGSKVFLDQGKWKFGMKGKCKPIITIDQVCEFFIGKFLKSPGTNQLDTIVKKYVGIRRDDIQFLNQAILSILPARTFKSSKSSVAKRSNPETISSRPVKRLKGGPRSSDISEVVEELSQGPGSPEDCELRSQGSVSPEISEYCRHSSQGPGSPGISKAWEQQKRLFHDSRRNDLEKYWEDQTRLDP
jgi:hypothetical protein